MRAFLRARPRGSEGAFTLLEVMISATVFLIVSGAVVTSLVVSTALNTSNRETALASRAAQSAIEELKATAFAEIYRRYNASAADDPVAGSSPGSAFAVQGLNTRSDDADGLAGSIQFPGSGKELLEDGVDADLGLPRDLNGDTVTDGADHAGDYRVLPVRVRVEWSGKSGPQALELVTVLTEL